MAKEELFVRGFPSWWMKSVGCIPVKRNAKDLSAIKEAMRRVRAGGGLLLFPEGTRQIKGQETNEPQAGVGFLAVKLGVPVVPAYAKGTELVLPKGAKKVKFKKISVRFGPQMAIDPKMSYEDAAALILKKIRELEKIH
jgi:1-acyl-sn-glycerol-3-phosphate acyltransferase